MHDLTDTERDILTFESLQWKFAGARQSAIRDQFDMSATRYAQVVNALIDKPAALAASPVTVRRLVRLREARKVARTR